MASPIHCAYCFDVIVDTLESKNGRRGRNETVNPSVFGKEKYPMFVTWRKHNGRDWRLRGCIGTFSARDLADGLREYALSSAFQDNRFSPLIHKEVPFLSCDVSLLTNFETAAHLDDWKIGTHGITIDFAINGKTYSATYLPEVASEQGWSRKQTITELISKAGYKKVLTTAQRESIKVTRYQSSKSSITYSQYTSWNSPKLCISTLQPDSETSTNHTSNLKIAKTGIEPKNDLTYQHEKDARNGKFPRLC